MAQLTPEKRAAFDEAIGDLCDSTNQFRRAYKEIFGTECETETFLNLARCLAFANIRVLNLETGRALDPRTPEGKRCDEVTDHVMDAITGEL
jgi:hypothetical protein